LLGDSVYGLQTKYIKRQALHAHKLAFEYKGQQFSFESPVPGDFERLISLLKKDAGNEHA